MAATICPHCFPWNTPLTMRPVYVVDAGPVALSFGQWILYHLHVVQHQANNWSGEIEQVVKELRQPAPPQHSLAPTPEIC